MYFQLLHGIHLECGRRFEVKHERDDQGVWKCVSQPIVESRADLVAAFGSEKFRRVSDDEARAILGTKGTKARVRKSKTPNPAPPPKEKESKVSEAVEKGAAEIAEPVGKDVTGRFAGTTDAGLKVYRQAANQYVVTSMKDGTNEFVTEEPIKKTEVEKLIKEWME